MPATIIRAEAPAPLIVPGSADWIDAYMSYTEGIPSPPIFRLWAAITAVGGALERRVWVQTARSLLYAHLYTLLVSPPAIGKTQAIAPIGDIWSMVKDLKVAPDNLTKAALIDALEKARRIVHPAGSTVEFHTMLVAASELGVFVSAHDLEFLSVLNAIYDAPRSYKEERRMNNKKIDIPKPQLTLLAGTQPGFLANLLPDEAWSMGFCSRLIIIYCNTTPDVDLFEEFPEQPEHLKSLVSNLTAISKLYGPCQWEDSAKEMVRLFNQHKRDTAPEHSKLQHYNSRRILHLLKLVMIAAVSARQELILRTVDVERAIDWLLYAEKFMPDLFREMKRKSDDDVLTELHRFMWALWKDKKQPIHESRLYNMLKSHVPSDRVWRLLDVAERSGMIQRMAGTGGKDGVPGLYIPRPTHEHGLE